MFCDACGGELHPGQAFCSKCGKQIIGPVSLAQPQPGRVREHVRLLGLLWLALGAFNTVGGVVLYIVANTIFAHFHPQVPPDAPNPGFFLRPLLSVIAIALLVKAAAGLIAGWGLVQQEPWARILALVLAFISLFNVPFGTALGVYTMWVLLPSQSEQEYEKLASARAA